MELRLNERVGETGDPRENSPANGIVRHDSHMRKSGVTRPGIEPGSPWWEESRLTAQPPLPHHMEQRRDTKVWGNGDSRENPPTSGIVQLDSHVRKSGGNPTGSRTRFVLVGCE
ncbi:hypothetical protein PR048_008269 [Dryococelus australis]|uniref:Uncharacterized protein n=1 Tax=Dryococelus australis TaxID=614101 RepID=A0ABQ9HWM2_9NEOP|nr:hypothetical protein PR048_008269 [Dryococelus australis]